LRQWRRRRSRCSAVLYASLFRRIEFMLSRSSSQCSRFGKRWPESPYRRAPPCSSRRRHGAAVVDFFPDEPPPSTCVHHSIANVWSRLDNTPRVCNRSTGWALDPAHSASRAGPCTQWWTEPATACHVDADVSTGVSADASHSIRSAHFSQKSLMFFKINPPSNPVQNNFCSLLV
jgi:hypothetical protein